MKFSVVLYAFLLFGSVIFFVQTSDVATDVLGLDNCLHTRYTLKADIQNTTEPLKKEHYDVNDIYDHKESALVFNASLVFLALLLGVFVSQFTSTEPPPFSGGTKRWFGVDLYNLYVVVLYGLLYCVSYGLCVALKFALDDRQCSLHANSVSGHFNFHVFYVLLSLKLVMQHTTSAKNDDDNSNNNNVSNSKNHASRKKSQKGGGKKTKKKKAKNGRKKPASATSGNRNVIRARADDSSEAFLLSRPIRELLLLTTGIFFIVLTSVTLYRTYTGGYHSLRQILWGCMLPPIFHMAAYDLLLSKAYWQAVALVWVGLTTMLPLAFALGHRMPFAVPELCVIGCALAYLSGYTYVVLCAQTHDTTKLTAAAGAAAAAAATATIKTGSTPDVELRRGGGSRMVLRKRKGKGTR